jgi:hypothetical protein
MMVQTFVRNRPVAVVRPPWTVAVVTTRAAEFPLAGVLHGMGYPLVVIGSIADAYFRIKRDAPERIVVYVASDDSEGCQLLSMLALDRETARIPVVTYMLPDVQEHDSYDADVFAQLESSPAN